MSPTPWNEQKQVPNFALGIQSTPRMDSNGVSRRSSNDSNYDKSGDNCNHHITSSNDDLLSSKSSSIGKGSKRLVPLSHPAVDVPLCMECQVKTNCVFTSLYSMTLGLLCVEANILMTNASSYIFLLGTGINFL